MIVNEYLGYISIPWETAVAKGANGDSWGNRRIGLSGGKRVGLGTVSIESKRGTGRVECPGFGNEGIGIWRRAAINIIAFRGDVYLRIIITGGTALAVGATSRVVSLAGTPVLSAMNWKTAGVGSLPDSRTPTVVCAVSR